MKRPSCSNILRRLAAGLAFAVLFAPCIGRHAASAEPDAAAAAARPQRFGRMLLERCVDAPAYCGRIERPLDPRGIVAGRISIHFELYPHSGAGPARGMLVATEGGPGYPATESRADYLALFAPLHASRDVLLMDNRGTGKSGAIDCAQLQRADHWTVELVGACGASLAERSALYSTAYAADDLAAILEALGAGPIDLYGDSYGTYFEQVFAVLHPHALRSIVLDGAYPLEGPDYAWYPTYAPAMRDKFNIACRRSASCAQLPGDSLDHIAPVLAQLRREPFMARAADGEGRERSFEADAAQLATVMFGSAPALATVKEVDAAARAFREGDRPPLLRLMAETVSGVDSRDPDDDPRLWSAGLAAAVMCQDPPQIFDMRLPPEARRTDRERVLAERRRAFPDTYAPFSIDEFRAMPLDYSFLDQCLDWPTAIEGHPASQVVPRGAAYPDVPALIISGELDNMTTIADGAQVSRAFRRGWQVIVANSFHVNALPRARSPCGAKIVRHFIETLEVGDSRCASEVPPVRLVPQFARYGRDLAPAQALSSNAASALQLRFASAAVLTAGDIVTRLALGSSGHGVGLRGGRFAIAERDGTQVATLQAVRWTEDLAVSGTVSKMRAAAGRVQAKLHVDGPEHLDGSLEITWDDASPDAIADIHGTLNGARVAARLPAP